MRVLLTGSSGFLGSALVPFLAGRGCHLGRLVRPRSRLGRGPARLGAGITSIPWDPAAGILDGRALEAYDAVIHLAGESLVSGLWTPWRKRRLVASRLQATSLLCSRLARLEHPPRTLLSASAVGFYGSHDMETLTEESPAGGGFLADLTQRWEAATEAASEAGIRVVLLRTGVVLDPSGGALARMLPALRRGLAPVLGSGRQYVSWIAMDDFLGLVLFTLENDGVAGPVNLVAPEPVTNRAFTSSLARAVGRRARLAVPAPFLRLLPGRMADEMLLASQRVLPRRAFDAGYTFRHPTLEDALREMLGHPQDEW